jgi:hypothetical protein
VRRDRFMQTRRACRVYYKGGFREYQTHY